MIRQVSPRKGEPTPLLPERPDFVPGLLVVRVKTDVVANVPDIRRTSAAALRSFRFATRIDEPLQYLQQRRLFKEVTPLFAQKKDVGKKSLAGMPAAAALAASVRYSENEDLQGINLVRVAGSANLTQVEKTLSRTPGVEYVHRVPARWPALARPAAASADPMVNRQWGLRAIRWFETDPLPDARKVKVAVLDTGIDSSHPELRDTIATYTHDGARADDIVGHGTHVAGIIAADPDNQMGIAGVCRCELHVWKIFGDEPADDDEYYVDEQMYLRALNAARNAQVSVVNLSIGGTKYSQTEEMLFRRLISAGVTVVAAMGNEYQGGNPVEYPAAYGGVIAVGASDEANHRAYFSNTGKHIHLCAPGTNILSTLPMQPSNCRAATEVEYAAWSGTSMATPHVAATAALILAKHPGLTPEQVDGRLKRTASRLPDMGGKRKTKELGAGLLNLSKAVQ